MCTRTCNAIGVVDPHIRNDTIKNKIRFSWWGAEELGLLGSQAYVRDLVTRNLTGQIAAYLNFDMIGSPNYQRGILNGSSNDAETPYAHNGCIKIQHLFESDLTAAGLTYQLTGFGSGNSYRSDYGPFVLAEIPAGGLFTGAEQVKPDGDRALFGGMARTSYDPCYHQSCDTIDNINTEVYLQFSQSAARLLQLLATTADIRTFLGGPAVKREEPTVKLETWPVMSNLHMY